jgi:hypothetical protein
MPVDARVSRRGAVDGREDTVPAMVARALALSLTACALASVVAGCGGGGNESSGGSTATGGATSTSTGVTTTTPALAGASTDPVSWKGKAKQTSLLTDVRAAAHDGFDRIVLQFRGDLPGYQVGYVQRPVLEDGSGKPVDVTGGAVLLVRMEPALDADLTKESAPRTYTGPTRLSPATSSVRELVRAGGFESVLSWAVGVDEKRPFRVTRLENPSRIVVDVSTRS